MKKIVLFSFMMLLFSGAFLNAQKMEVKSGAIDFLKNQKTLLVKYDYSNMAVPKYESEANYIEVKVKEGNDAEPGKGDKWKEEWFGKRTTAYEPSFEELFNKGLEKNGLSCSKTATGAEYSMTIHTTSIQPGYFIGISAKPSYINAEITFTKISSGENVAVITAEKCTGMGGNKECYAKLGKTLAVMISKKF